MKIFTSYFGRAKALTKAGIIPIAISVSPPRYWKGETMKQLAPTYAMLKLGNGEYRSKFDQILYKLDKIDIIDALQEVSDRNGGADVAILCYEKPEDFCHRQMVASWLNDIMDDSEKIIEWDTIPPPEPENNFDINDD